MSFPKSPTGLHHRDWFIAVIPHKGGFGFCCQHPTLGRQTDGIIYDRPEIAVIAGCRFIDREQALSALVTVFEEWVQEDRISLEEYWKLSAFDPQPQD